MEPTIQAPRDGMDRGRQPLLPEAFRNLGEQELLVNEFFLSIQGESTHAGWPCFFIRLTGCHLRCTWCDTEYSFHEGRVHTVESCIQRARDAAVARVEVTGGEPLLQKAVRPLLSGLADEGFTVLLETSGASDIRGLDPRVVRIVDIKCPLSAMADRNRKGLENDLRSTDELKFVLAGREDYVWALDWLTRHRRGLPQEIPVLFSPATGLLSPEDLSAWILEDHVRVRLNLQLHKVIWNPDRRGV